MFAEANRAQLEADDASQQQGKPDDAHQDRVVAGEGKLPAVVDLSTHGVTLDAGRGVRHRCLDGGRRVLADDGRDGRRGGRLRGRGCRQLGRGRCGCGRRDDLHRRAVEVAIDDEVPHVRRGLPRHVVRVGEPQRDGHPGLAHGSQPEVERLAGDAATLREETFDRRLAAHLDAPVLHGQLGAVGGVLVADDGHVTDEVAGGLVAQGADVDRGVLVGRCGHGGEAEEAEGHDEDGGDSLDQLHLSCSILLHEPGRVT